MKQIGAELGVNESRVSQIHKTALEKLGLALRNNGFESSQVFLQDA
jgi:DNA-directed RNA polymerase specialized sigma subunit